LPGSNTDTNNQTLSRRLILRTDKGERFLCDLPTPPDSDEDETPLLSPEEQALINQEGVNRGVATLNSKKDKCIAAKVGWWTYKFCYNKKVTQFHMPTPDEDVKEETPITEFVLGNFAHPLPVSSVLSAGEEDEIESFVELKENVNPNNRIATVKTTPNRNVLVQRWGGGTPCDLNKQLRSIEIHYRCFPGNTDQFLSIKEPKSCHYLLEIGSPQLCKDSFYAEKNVSIIHPIKCAEVVEDVDLESRQKEALQRATAKKEIEDAKTKKVKKMKETSFQFSNLFTLVSPGVPGGAKLQNILQGIMNQQEPSNPQENTESNPESQETTDKKVDSQGKEEAFFEVLTKILKLSTDSNSDEKGTENEEEKDNYDEL